MSAIIGIDLGCCYSSVGVPERGKAEILQNEHGSNVTPSCIAFRDGKPVVGDDAKENLVNDMANTVIDSKLLIGRMSSDLVVQKSIKQWRFKVDTNSNGRPVVVVKHNGQSKSLSPRQIISLILVKMREIAQAHLQSRVKRAVVAVPSYFDPE